MVSEERDGPSLGHILVIVGAGSQLHEFNYIILSMYI